ncbi:MAG: hypothetical protein PWQ35_11 [Patescibacteria group bacterium]|nr:hypothetical protein [Patescibacteria group bacterium]
MFDYLYQFNSLPQALKDKVSSAQVMKSLTELEKRYQVDLAMIVMKIMIKSIDIKDLPSILISEFNLLSNQAEALTKEMKEKIFADVADYVGISSEIRSLNLENDLDKLIKAAGISITSSLLADRLRKILTTYLKGIRSRIDTRQSLTKSVSAGGLGLTDLEVDRVFKVCDIEKFQPSTSSLSPSALSHSTENIEQSTEVKESPNIKVAEYDLKKALASGETKSIALSAEIKTEPEKEAEVISEEKPLEAQDEATLKTEDVLSEIQKEINELPASQGAKIDLEKTAFVVKKPEKSGLFTKLFAEEARQTEKGAIKLAQRIDAVEAMQKQTTRKDEQVTAVKPEKKIIPPPPVMARNQVQPNRRPRLDDVRVVPKVMGPLEELQFLDLVNFRRLSQDPEEATTKIFNKIKLLEKDGYDKMIAGIAAWKKSAVNRLYLKMMQTAIDSGKSIKELANNSPRENFLTYPEIEAIINLNSRLTF